MAQLPFESEPLAEAARRSSAIKPLTVSQLSSLIKATLADAMPRKVRVVGEVSNFSDRAHWFFSLKDEGATLRCVCFASAAKRVSFPVKDGLQVVASGRVDYYESQGHLQLYVETIEPVGVGELELRFRALCEELRVKGYFDPARKKPLPPLPRCIAVVTSRTGAALQDVINTAAKRWRGCRLLLLDARVQGAAAAPEIAAAIRALSRHGPKLNIDAIVLTRGGGSMEDLWAFNERIVADAIYECSLPIVAAIGHETDTTIAELVADLRCATPTQAAMQLIPDATALQHQVDQLGKRLTLLVHRHVQHSRQRLETSARHPVFRRPLHMLDPHKHHLDNLTQRLRTQLPQRLATQRQRLEAMHRQLVAIGPQNVLDRGYSYTLGPDGHVLDNAENVKPGDRITSVLAKGRVTSTVEGQTAPKPDNRDRPTATPAPRKRRATPGDDQPGLFGDRDASQ